MRTKHIALSILTLAFAAALLLQAAQNPSPIAQTTDILAYIKQTWQVLTRSNSNLATAAVDPKFHPDAEGRWPVYISRTEDVRLVEESLRREM